LELAEKQGASFPQVLGHNNFGGSLLLLGDIAEARPHFDQAIALYDPAAHRSLAARFGEDQTVSGPRRDNVAFGDAWQQSYLPEGYSALMTAYSVHHFLVSESLTTK
jgi:hypothetical protein